MTILLIFCTLWRLFVYILYFFFYIIFMYVKSLLVYFLYSDVYLTLWCNYLPLIFFFFLFGVFFFFSFFHFFFFLFRLISVYVRSVKIFLFLVIFKTVVDLVILYIKTVLWYWHFMLRFINWVFCIIYLMQF